jgi:Protein-disulfide isomerase
MINKKESYIWLWVLIGTIAVSLIVYWLFATGGKTVSDMANAPLIINQRDRFKGPANAKVTLVEYADFQCPVCAAYFSILQEVYKTHGDRVKFVFRNFPLTQIHQNAMIAHKIAEAAGLQGKFWEMHDLLYINQKEWKDSLEAKSKIMSYAGGLGIDLIKLEQDINSQEVEEKILADLRDGMNRGVKGTPTFYLNGVKLENINTSDDFRKVLDEYLAR